MPLFYFVAACHAISSLCHTSTIQHNKNLTCSTVTELSLFSSDLFLILRRANRFSRCKTSRLKLHPRQNIENIMQKTLSARLGTLLAGSLVKQIMIGLIAGVALAWISHDAAIAVGLLGELFVSALKAVAPLLVLMLVIASIANHQQGQKSNIRPIIMLYLLSTFFAAVVAVVFSHLIPQTLTLAVGTTEITPPSGITEVLRGLLMSMVSNPITALMNANYIGILVWAIGLGLAFRHSSDTTRAFLNDASHAVTWLVRCVIRCAPIGIFGLVASILASTGFGALWQYAHLLALLLGCMLLMALVVNPLLVFYKIRRNPYPLVFTCLRESGVTAFFTRSSAANIPVNMALAKRLDLDEDTYSVSIPLGATISMAGASITITVLTLAAVHTLGHLLLALMRL